jgi:hypothetical protein
MDAKSKYSNFHVTVNFNVDDEAHIHEMREAVEAMATLPTLWLWLRQFNGEAQVPSTVCQLSAQCAEKLVAPR